MCQNKSWNRVGAKQNCIRVSKTDEIYETKRTRNSTIENKLPKVDVGELKAEHFPNHSLKEVFAALYNCPNESRKSVTEFIMNSYRIKSTLEANKDKSGIKPLTFGQLCKLYEKMRSEFAE